MIYEVIPIKKKKLEGGVSKRMSGTVDHIGIAVRNIEESISFFQEIFGAKILRKNVVEEEKLISCVISMGSINLELMQPTEKNSVIDKFISKNGEGVHHISIRVENLEKFLRELDSKKLIVLNTAIKPNYKVAFLHPKTTFGMLIELIERLNINNA
jgi:methylmalonyl-CoA/ethylmalonyl-CoA epimerase